MSVTSERPVGPPPCPTIWGGGDVSTPNVPRPGGGRPHRHNTPQRLRAALIPSTAPAHPAAGQPVRLQALLRRGLPPFHPGAAGAPGGEGWPRDAAKGLLTIHSIRLLCAQTGHTKDQGKQPSQLAGTHDSFLFSQTASKREGACAWVGFSKSFKATL